MRGMFVEGKLLKGDILVSKTNNTPAYPAPFIKIRQEEGFWGEGCPGFWSYSSLALNTRPHRTESTKAEQVNTNTETASRVRNRAGSLPHRSPSSILLLRTRFHIISTMTAAWILRASDGGEEGGLAGHRIYPPPCKRKPVSALYTCGEWAYNDGDAITDLTVSSWVSRVVRSGLVIIEHCQNTGKLQPSVW